MKYLHNTAYAQLEWAIVVITKNRQMKNIVTQDRHVVKFSVVRVWKICYPV